LLILTVTAGVSKIANFWQYLPNSAPFGDPGSAVNESLGLPNIAKETSVQRTNRGRQHF